ncbi:MAG: DUF6428 family protein [Pikeienuella sp.]
MTLNSLLKTLSDMPASAKLIFRTEQGDVGAGYHMTEFKHAKITSIDCGARVSEWHETSMQILDGKGRAHMEVGKFVRILRQSLARLEKLGDAPTTVEFAPGNLGLRTYEMEKPELIGDHVVIRMSEKSAMCKPSGVFSGLRKSNGLTKPQPNPRECCA